MCVICAVLRLTCTVLPLCERHLKAVLHVAKVMMILHCGGSTGGNHWKSFTCQTKQ